jgi:hypothetical protein
MNRLRSQEKLESHAPRRCMNAHYANALLLMPTTWMGSYILYRRRVRVGHTDGGGQNMYRYGPKLVWSGMEVLEGGYLKGSMF